jgi:hypothetical protein
MIIIQITQREADYINTHLDCNQRNLKKASSRKKHGGKTYYVMNDDINSLRLLAELRGYNVPNPVKRLLADN